MITSKNNKTHETLLYITFGAVLFIFCWLAILTGMVFGVCEDVLNITATEPETDVMIETTECTAAPEPTDILPTIKETIPAEIKETMYVDVEDPVNDVTEPAIDPYDLELLACVIYQEAGGDSSCDECRRRVADVVLNRVNDPDRFPDTIRGVLTAYRQYGRFHWTGVVWPKRASYYGEKHAVERAYRIAKEVLSGKHSSLYGQGYVWQAEFKQGTDIVYCCGHYFGR